MPILNDGIRDLLNAPHQLWIVFWMKFAEAFAFFSLMYVLVKYLSDELGFTDVEAGWLFAFCNGMQFPFALGLSFILDRWGVRYMCILGEVLLLCARLLLWQVGSHSRLLVCAVLLGLYPLGTAVLLPALIVGVKRFTTESSRPYAFGLFYTLLNIASLCNAGVLNLLRGWSVDDSSVYSIVLCLGCIVSVSGLFCSPMLYEREDVEQTHQLPTPSTTSFSTTMQGFQTSRFWRFMAVILSFVMIRMIFGHLTATVPKWMPREFGEQVAYELYIGINPALIIVLVPICTRICDVIHAKMETALIAGAFISGFSPFILAFAKPDVLAVAAFIVVFSIGEAIWSPKLLEYSVAVPDRGREGIYVSCGSAPLYLSKFAAGVTSGYLLQQYCPTHDPACRTRALWLAIALTTSVTPMILIVFRSCLFHHMEESIEESAALLKKERS